MPSDLEKQLNVLNKKFQQSKKKINSTQSVMEKIAGMWQRNVENRLAGNVLKDTSIHWETTPDTTLLISESDQIIENNELFEFTDKEWAEAQKILNSHIEKSFK